MHSEHLPTNAELAYIAGFFDGEGCVCIYRVRNRTYALAVSVSQVDPRPLIFVSKFFGGKVSARPPQKGHSKLPYFQWRLSASNACYFLEQILPFLINKKDQATIAIEFQENIGHRSVYRLSDNVVSIRRGLAEKAAFLKKQLYSLP